MAGRTVRGMERSTGVQAYYAESAERLGRVYESVSFEDVHGALLDLLPPAPARVLDVGAGTGRDAVRWHAVALQLG
ncbi:ubiquinone/menaquinone biosynthesis C-methylase UbiE [Streptomyces sp. SAI-041]|nr:ubiquinone/menaquinone biosynthesis C-methylase UbiE [Streptomyces sp. SAI-041]